MRRNGKKALSLVLALVLVLGMVPGSALAAEPTSGTCGDNVTWTLENGTLTISGTGRMTNYGYHGHYTYAPWYNQCEAITSVIINNGVTSIGDSAFSDCTNLTSVTIPNSVTSIEAWAFGDCTKLIRVSIPDGVTSIRYAAFKGCTGLTSVTIPNSVTSIEGQVFDGCTGLTSVTIPNSVTSIGYGAFDGCTGLTSVTIPDSVTSIYEYAFCDCTSLTSLIIPDSVTRIDGGAFCRSGLTSVIIPDSVTCISCYAFEDCTGLTSVTIPNGVTSIDSWAFNGCTGLADVYYKGSETQWQQIDIRTANQLLLGATIHYNSTGANEYIVEEVKKYATQVDSEQLNDILTSKESDAVKMQRFQEFFTLNGFTDVQEGVKFLTQDSFAERWAYKKLTTDECYAAYQTQKFLNDNPQWRALLVADGLVFNGELSTYVNPLTYTDIGNLPHISNYKNVLYEFMDAQSFEVEVMDYISWVNGLAGKVDSSAKIYADNLISQLNKCKDSKELRTLMNQATTKEIFLKLGYDDTKPGWELEYQLDENTGFGKFNKAMGKAGNFISLCNLTVDTTIDFMELDSKLAVYASYEDFLNEVVSSKDLPLGMRIAATQIMDEIDSGVWGRLKELVVDILEQTKATKKLEDKGLTTILGKAGHTTFSEIMLYLDLGSWAINQVFDIGSIVTGSAYAEAYSKLSTHFKNKLEESRLAFLANQTTENAWDFYENYNILYALRKNGEKAALKAHTFKAGSSVLSLMLSNGYSYLNSTKEECIAEILDELENCKFTVAANIQVPDSVKYISKSVTACPVNIEVYAPDGTYITTLKDGVESDITNQYGRFAVVYRTYTGDYAKIICMSQKGDYKCNIIGTDDGLVDFEMATANNGRVKTYKFANEPISKGTLIKTSTADLVNQQTYSVDTNGDGIVDKQKTATVKADNSENISVTRIELNETKVVLQAGESKLLTVSIMPANATIKNVVWTTDNENIAEIKNGKIVAKSAGSTSIHCMSLNNPDVVASCNVTVTGTSLSFTDVPTGAYYYDAVQWAVEQGIVNGTSATTFSPDDPCTRAQIVTILWRAAGSPTASESNRFTDISQGSYYYDAVLWAVSQGITTGTSATTFSPDAVCTRAQAVTFLHRAAGSPAAAGPSPFTDVVSGSYYADAVQWAVSKGVVNGTTPTTFSPEQTCTRAQIVTILYRDRAGNI